METAQEYNERMRIARQKEYEKLWATPYDQIDDILENGMQTIQEKKDAIRSMYPYKE